MEEDILDIQADEDLEYICPEGEDVRPVDPFDPFCNPTENHSYNADYSETVPQIKHERCRLPLIPAAAEKKRIRRTYTAAGLAVVTNYIIALIVFNILTIAAALAVMSANGISASEFYTGGGAKAMNYMNNTSISQAIMMLSYLTANLTTFFLFAKILKYKARSFFRTSGFRPDSAMQYILIGFFIHFGSIIIINILINLFRDADIVGASQSVVSYTSAKALAVSGLYTCLVAPVTEELIFRGIILRSFSKVSQRFGILMSSMLFGLVHGNVLQFVAALTLGFFMSYIDIKHNSLLPSMIVHASINTFNFITVLISRFFAGTENSVSADTMLNFAAIALAVIGAAMLLIFARSNVYPRSGIHQQYRCGKVAVSSVGTLAAFGLFGFLMIRNTFF